MDGENKSNNQDIDDEFEIGIQIDDTLGPFESTDAQSDDTADETEPENAIEKQIDDDNETLPIPGPLDEIKLKLDDLASGFESKIKYDEHKNKIIDDLHQALQEYREGLIKKYLHRIVIDVIKIVDDMRKFAAHYDNQPHTEETDNFLQYMENITSDMEDLFSWEGVVPFTCEGDVFDPTRQRIVDKVETDDPAKDKTIAQRLRPGYEWDGKVIRPEMISAFIYPKAEPITKDDDIS